MPWYDDMRLLAYEGGLGAVVIRRAAAVFVLVINGGRVGGFVGVADGGIFVVGDAGGEDAHFAVEGTGASGGDTSVAMLMDRRNAIGDKRGLRFLFVDQVYLLFNSIHVQHELNVR